MLSLTALVFSVQPHLGLADGELHWNIAQDITGNVTPNVLSELEFENIDAVQTGLDLQIQAPLFWDRLTVFLEGGASIAAVQQGDNTDTDYLGNNRTDVYSLSESEINGNDIIDYHGGAGLTYAIVPNRHFASLSFGGFHQEQELNFQNGVQIIAEPSFFQPVTLEQLNASLRRLDSIYLARWWGPWFATAYKWQGQRWSLKFRYQYFQGQYYGEGEWNLREDFRQPRSFVHEADAYGSSAEVTAGYGINDSLSVFVTWMTNDWQTDSGVVSTYFSNDTFSRVRFNDASWESRNWLFGLRYDF